MESRITQEQETEEPRRRAAPSCSTGSAAIRLLRPVLFLGIIASLWLPWYQSDSGVGSGWDLALEATGWTLGLCCLPYVFFLSAGAVSSLSARCWALWLYRAALLGWVVIFGLITVGDSPEFIGGWVSVSAALVAVAAETVDFIQAARRRKKAPA